VDQTTHQFLRNPPSKGDHKAHLIITSPPTVMSPETDRYWIEQNSRISNLLSKGKSHRALEAQHKVLDKTWSLAYDLLSTGGYLCIIARRSSRKIADRHIFFDNPSRITYACQKLGFDALPSIKWRKPSKTPPHYMGSGMLPAGAYVVPQHDDVLIFRKGAPRNFNKEEQERRAESALFCEERNEWYLDHWSDVKSNALDIYTSEFTSRDTPSELYVRLMMMYSIQGDTVLDLFGGNLLTSLAGITIGRNTQSIMIEDRDESLAIFSKRKLKALLNDRSASRITDHMAYAKTKNGLLLRYKNQPLGLPVQTQQEKHIQSFVVQSIKKVENEISVKYRKWKKAELSDLLKP